MNLTYPSRVSSQLVSQTMSKFLVDEILWRFDRQVYETYRKHDISIEPWAVGIRVYGAGVRGGLISYRDLVSMLQDEALCKAVQRQVIKKNDRLWIVEGSQKKWYCVWSNGTRHTCECMRYLCWKNRMSVEFPALYKALGGRIFCQHTVAARQFEGYDPLHLF